MPGFPIVYPGAARVIEPTSMATGQFIGSRPMGLTVHYTADRDAERARRALVERRLGYHLLIGRDGAVTQLTYLDRRVAHAGPSEWRKMSCNRWFAAVALVSWGELQAGGKTWTGQPLAAAETGTRPYNVGSKMALWDMATPAQEARLLEVVRWFIGQGMDPRSIAGHDEAAIPPGRKVDPGGVLSFTMAALRESLCEDAGIDP